MILALGLEQVSYGSNKEGGGGGKKKNALKGDGGGEDGESGGERMRLARVEGFRE